MKSRALVLALAGMIGLAWPNVQAETPTAVYDLPKVVAVQNRAYSVKNDLSLQGGYLPSDAFNKGYTLGASYSRFFNDYLGWEVVNANYSFNAGTGLKRDLIDCCEVEAQTKLGGALDYVQWFAVTSVVYTPLYTKSLLFNRDVIRGEISFVGGAGVAHFSEAGNRALLSTGLYLRFFARNDRSWKFDFRNNTYFEGSLGIVNAVSLMVGYSFHFGGQEQPPATEAHDEL